METKEEGIQLEDYSVMPRKERRARTRYFKKMLVNHMKSKPTVDLEEDDPEKLEIQQAKVRAWVTRFHILKRKLSDLELKRNSAGDYQPSETGVGNPGEEETRDGSTENEDLSDMSTTEEG